MMNDHQRETAFLKGVILYDNTPECYKLQERITRAQRDEHCVRRAAWLMALLTALAAAGLGYAAVFLPDFPENRAYAVVNVLAALGLGSLICLVVFVAYWALQRHELDKQRDECRRLAARLLEARLGRPRVGEAIAMLKEPVPVEAVDESIRS